MCMRSVLSLLTKYHELLNYNQDLFGQFREFIVLCSYVSSYSLICAIFLYPHFYPVQV